MKSWRNGGNEFSYRCFMRKKRWWNFKFCTLFAKTKNSLADHKEPNALYNHSNALPADLDLVLEKASKNCADQSAHCFTRVSIIANWIPTLILFLILLENPSNS